MGDRVKYFPADYRWAEASSPEDSVRFDLPVDADLQRKVVSSHPEIKKITDRGLHGRSYQPEERFSGSTPTYETMDFQRSEITPRFAFEDIPRLGRETPAGEHLHELEDRVQDKSSGKVFRFDQLPEVRDLQYRVTALPMIKKALASSDPDGAFREYKESIQQEPAWNDRGEGHRFVIPVHGGSRKYDGFVAFHPSHFWVEERTGGEDLSNHWTRSNDDSSYSTRDFFRQNHSNLNERFLDSKTKAESISEHLNGLTQSYNDLWDKLDSGLYIRHPQFWSGHAFSAGNNRDSAWEQIQRQAPALKLD